MFKDKIRKHYEELTPGFRVLADFITVHTMDAAFLTTTELAKRVGVDQATVVRFAQSVGYSGYRELSKEVKAYVLSQVTTGYREAAEAQTPEEMAQALALNAIQQIKQSITSEAEKLGQVVEMLNNANHIWLVGESTSYPLAHYLCETLKIVGISATLFQPSLRESATILAQMKAGDALVAMSIRNPSLDTGYMVRLAREKGLKTVTFTDFGVGLPAREAEVTITADTTSPTGIPSISPLFTMISIMWEMLVNQRPEESADAFTQFNNNWGEMLEQRTETYEEDLSYFED